MAIIVVGGSQKGVGKTALVCGLIRALPEFHWTAIKITTHDHGQSASVWEEKEPGQGTDTARYRAAGAARALLTTLHDDPESLDNGFQKRLSELWRMLGPDANVIFESNTVVQHIKPDLCIAVEGSENPSQSKRSFSRISQRADATVSRADANREIAGVRPVFQLAAFEQISPEMLAWIRQRLPTQP